MKRVRWKLYNSAGKCVNVFWTKKAAVVASHSVVNSKIVRVQYDDGNQLALDGMSVSDLSK